MIGRFDGETARLDEWLDDLSRTTDYHMVQGGDDFAGPTGYHFTSHAGLSVIIRDGLGSHPGYVEAHELPFWMVTFLARDRTNFV